MTPRPNPALATSRRVTASTMIAAAVLTGGLVLELDHANGTTSTTSSTSATSSTTSTDTTAQAVSVTAGTTAPQGMTSGS